MSLWSLVMDTPRFRGSTFCLASSMMALMAEDASSRFSPARFTTSRETTGRVYSRAKLSASFSTNATVATSRRWMMLPPSALMMTFSNSSTLVKSPSTCTLRRTPSMRRSPPEIVMFSAAMAPEMSLKLTCMASARKWSTSISTSRSLMPWMSTLLIWGSASISSSRYSAYFFKSCNR